MIPADANHQIKVFCDVFEDGTLFLHSWVAGSARCVGHDF